MTTSSIRAKIDCPIERVWAVVTAVDDYSWRSDLSGTEILDERRFVEYAKGGIATTFTVTAMETCRRWEFDMENANMTGHWSGVFTAGGSVRAYSPRRFSARAADSLPLRCSARSSRTHRLSQ